MVYLSNMKLVLMAPPCVGKNLSSHCCLTGLTLKPITVQHLNSTRPIHAIERVTQNSKGKVWEIVNGLDLLKMLSDAILALDEKSEASTSNVSSQNSKTPPSISIEEVGPIVFPEPSPKFCRDVSLLAIAMLPLHEKLLNRIK